MDWFDRILEVGWWLMFIVVVAPLVGGFLYTMIVLGCDKLFVRTAVTNWSTVAAGFSQLRAG